jgi:hypothetical protein
MSLAFGECSVWRFARLEETLEGARRAVRKLLWTAREKGHRCVPGKMSETVVHSQSCAYKDIS